MNEQDQSKTEGGGAVASSDLLGFQPQPPIKGSTACLTCGCGSHDTMSMDALLGVGFGDCTVTKDGEQIYSEMATTHEAERQGKDLMLWEGKDAEEAAAKDPNHDWRVHFFAPLYEAEYQRQGDGHWPLISKGLGFA
jgi:hypothetical protein